MVATNSARFHCLTRLRSGPSGPRQAQSPDQTSNAAAATIASKATVLTIVHRPRSSPLEIQQKELSGLVALMGLVAPHRSNNIQPSDVGVLDDLACHGH